MDARERFIAGVAKTVSDALYREGFLFLDVRQIEAIAEEEQTPDHEARAVLELLDSNGLLLAQEGGHTFSDGEGLVLRYEEANRPVHWERNVLRRRILKLAAAAYEDGANELVYHGDAEKFIDMPWEETFAACQILKYLGYLELRPAMGHNFWAWISPEGYELQRDERTFARALPTSAAEDEEAGEDVAADALRELVTSVEELLRKRGWEGAARELERGDAQYSDGHWTDAVREYYAALESGLKHRLDERGDQYSETDSLRALAKHASIAGAIPPNYQELFGFADSIRSPRSHGAGGKPEAVEVGQAEALLMGNHVRALLLYLGHRPS